MNFEVGHCLVIMAQRGVLEYTNGPDSVLEKSQRWGGYIPVL